MIKLTGGQASAFNSPVIGKLFTDPKRQFPFKEAFQLSDLIQQIQEKLQLYNEQLKKIIDTTGGVVDPKNGLVSYPDSSSQLKAQALIDELNKAPIEVTGEALVMSADWPNLTLAEATILRPLIKENGRT